MKRFALAACLSLVATSVTAQSIVIRTGLNISDVLATPVVEGRLTFALPSGEKITVPIEYVEIDMSKAVSSQGRGQAAPAPRPSVNTTPTPSASPTDIINSKCAAEWKADFQMQAYCRRTQTDALDKLRQRNMSSGDRSTIREQCIKQWAGDFQMMNYCEETQIKALQSLGR